MTDRYAIEVGTRVAYRREFLRSLDDLTAVSAERRGTVTEIGRANFCTVSWDDGTKGRVNLGNLIRADSLHLEDR